ncbi:choice-of-anchor I family protein [Aureivirga marina]|uniref:choice-of-anchor I family protein n=1 Tax=Aureivirga marina TaxID=1182451 RepID=UPI0018CB8A0A|nr:choice-of-anchor I family protein [Aureivirga marina]
MNKNYSFLLAFLLSMITFAQTPVITSYVDSPCSGASGRVLEIYVNGTVDLTDWNVQRQANGNGFTTNINLSSLGTITDSFIYITNGAETFETEYAITTNVLESGTISSNGDDAFQIVNPEGIIIDRFGEDGVDGSDTSWEHVDTYYKRNDNVVANNGNFNVANWTFGNQGFFLGKGTCNDGGALSSHFALGTFTIINEEQNAVVSFEEEIYTVSESESSILINLTLDEATTSQATVDVTLFLSNNENFTFSTQTITFEEDETSKEFSVEIPQNTEINKDYFIALQLSNFSNLDLGEEEFTTIYVSDDELHLDGDAPNSLGMIYETSFSDLGGAEILTHDPVSQKLFVTNSEENTLQILDFSDVSSISLEDSIDLSPYGSSVTSVTIFEELVAVSIKSADFSNGKVVFLNTSGDILANVEVGVLPDMLTFTPNGNSILVANEGEPNDDYTIDPEGSISIISIPDNIAEISASNVTNLDFNAYDSELENLKNANIRIFGLNASVSQDLEPEYITISEDSSTAWVVLQENNAYATIDLISNTITDIKSFGFKDHSLEKNAFDTSNDTDFIFMSTWNVKGMFQPDGIANFEKDGVKYIVTANEGDGRDYDGFSEEERVKDLELDETAFPNADFIQEKRNLGRLKITTALGDTDNDGDFDELYSYGARSFSIFNAQTGELVYDSADLMERIIKENPMYSEMFNTSNSSDSFKNRSDDKGPEPEGVIVQEINDKFYAFVGLERIGGIMVFDITNPTAPIFEVYVNNRTFDDVENDDLGPEGLIYIAPNDNSLEKGLIVVANEVSASISVYSLENVDPTIHVEDYTKTSEINLYPNPSNSVVFLSKPANFEVFDTLGRKVLEGKNASKIKISSLTKGTYIVKFEKGNNTKLIVN